MASNMESNSSKTAHVMNLLNRNHGAAQSAPAEPAPAEETAAEPAPAEETAAEPAPAEEAAAEPAPAAPQNPPKAAQNSEPIRTSYPAGGPEPEEEKPEFESINVMQILVDRLVDGYMDKFDMCHCNRCRADVMALALSNLPGKYMVMDQSMISPWLSMCEKKHSAEITMEIMKACQMVKENPRHKG